MRLDKIMKKELQELSVAKIPHDEYVRRLKGLEDKYKPQKLLFTKVRKAHLKKIEKMIIQNKQDKPYYCFLVINLIRIYETFEYRFGHKEENGYISIDMGGDFMLADRIPTSFKTALKQLITSYDRIEDYTTVKKRLDYYILCTDFEYIVNGIRKNTEKKIKENWEFWKKLNDKDAIFVKNIIIYVSCLEMILTKDIRSELLKDFPNSEKEIKNIVKYIKSTSTKLSKNVMEVLLNEIHGLRSV